MLSAGPKKRLKFHLVEHMGWNSNISDTNGGVSCWTKERFKFHLNADICGELDLGIGLIFGLEI